MPYDPETLENPSPKLATRFRFDLFAQPGDVISASAREGEPTPTRIPWLDGRLRRGGLTPARLYGICGPPWSGKTTILCDVALAVSDRTPVFALFSDEGRTQAAARMGVMLGIPIDEIEEKPAQAGALITERLAEHSIYLAKPDSEIANAEAMFDQACERIPKGENALILLDSAQTIPPNDKEPDSASEWGVVRRFIDLTRKRAESDGRSVLISSKANRASWKNRKAEENTVPMAAWQGGAIEYQVDFGLLLAIPEEDSGIVKAKITKNRLGHLVKSKQLPNTFQLRYDETSGRLLELDQNAAADANASAANTRLATLKAAAIDQIRRHNTEGLSSSQVQKLIGCRRADLFDALRQLSSEGKIMDYTVGKQGIIYRVL